MDNFYLLTFKNTHDAMNAESVLKSNNFDIVIMPTPTFVTKSCGLSIKVDVECFTNVVNFIKEGKVQIKETYLKEEGKYKKVEAL